MGLGCGRYYTERLEVGYRWYSAHNVTPKFAFGHGLSYTVFAYTGISATGTSIAVTVVSAHRSSSSSSSTPLPVDTACDRASRSS